MPDLLGFEQRSRRGSSDADAERLDAFHRIAAGSSLQAKHTRDIAVLTTWLSEHERLSGPVGIIGHSLGGQVSFFSLAFDKRLRLGVISCGLGTVASFAEHGIPHNPAWFVPGITAAGDTPALAASLGNQRVVVVAGADDILFPLEGVRAATSAFPSGTSETLIVPGKHEFSESTMQLAIGLFGSHS